MVIIATLGLHGQSLISSLNSFAVVVLPTDTDPEIEMIKGTESIGEPKNFCITAKRSWRLM